MSSNPPTRTGRAMRAARNMRPIVHAMLMTTAVAWSINTRVPGVETAPSKPSQSISANEGTRKSIDGTRRLSLAFDGRNPAQRPGT